MTSMTTHYVCSTQVSSFDTVSSYHTVVDVQHGVPPPPRDEHGLSWVLNAFDYGDSLLRGEALGGGRRRKIDGHKRKGDIDRTCCKHNC